MTQPKPNDNASDSAQAQPSSQPASQPSDQPATADTTATTGETVNAAPGTVGAPVDPQAPGNAGGSLNPATPVEPVASGAVVAPDAHHGSLDTVGDGSDLMGSASTKMPTAQATDQAMLRLKDVGLGHVKLAVPDTQWVLDFQIDPKVADRLKAKLGKRVTGVARAQAQRADVIAAGGLYVEPITGRPRRLQGRISRVDAAARTITVHCGLPVVCTLDPNQAPSLFTKGQMVCFDIEPGATFEPA